jgi:hypothetical protein
MIHLRGIVGAIALAVLTIGFPQKLVAETTSADFLKWETSRQASFVNVSLFMLFTASTRVNQSFADCLGEWYFTKDANKDARNAELLKAFESFPDHHPTAILVGYAEPICGDVAG